MQNPPSRIVILTCEVAPSIKATTMTNQPSFSRGGAEISARNVSPSLQLDKLSGILAESITPKSVSESTLSPSASPLVKIEGRKIILNISSVLRRMYQMPQFKVDFSPGEGTGFLRDMIIPPAGCVAKVGGRLLHGTEVNTAKMLDKLQCNIASAIDSSLGDVDLSIFTEASTQNLLSVLAASVSKSPPILPTDGLMTPIKFSSRIKPANDPFGDVARVISATENVAGKDWLEPFIKGIEKKLSNNGLEIDEIEETITAIRNQSNHPGSQLHNFLNFLDDQALSRVRLHVTMKLMDAIAHQSTINGFNAYVSRVAECYEMFGGSAGSSFYLDPEIIYGNNNAFDLGNNLRTSTFYTCLPVWAEGSVQLFEKRLETINGFNTDREVSYRFRVNGINPQDGLTSINSRLEKIREKLLENPDPKAYVKNKIAQLIFLHLVIPDDFEKPSCVDISAESKRLVAQVKLDPVGTFKRLHTSLLERASVMDKIKDELIKILRVKTTKVISSTKKITGNFKISIHKDIINWAEIYSIGVKSNILVRSERGNDSIEWLKHISVLENAVALGSISSYMVKTELNERSLTQVESPTSITLKRDLSAPSLPVRYIPHKWSSNEQKWFHSIPDINVFDAGCGIEIQYEMNALAINKPHENNESVMLNSEYMRAASVSAFTLLVYVTLWELQRRIRQKVPGITITMLRLQHTGKIADRDKDALDGNTAVYAASHAIERALAREGPVKLQGLTTSDENFKWKSNGALNALLGGQALQFTMGGSLEDVAVVTYVTRPCDTHPSCADADGYIFMSRTYVAKKTDDGFVMTVLRMRSRLVESSKEFQNPQPILEEIARLRSEGFRHVMLLSHHFGNRHIGRAAERHAPHGTLKFLDEAFKRFPDMYLYPLRRDIFPAIRLRVRNSAESAFEVINFKDHQDMHLADKDTYRSVLPIYTFATLKVVGEDRNRPQSGFCTYFFDTEQRIANIEKSETVRHNIIGLGNAIDIRNSLISVLRAIHFLESEKPAEKKILLPVLDPFDWANPTTSAASGEVEVIRRKRGGKSVLLSLPALLAHATKALHKDDNE